MIMGFEVIMSLLSEHLFSAEKNQRFDHGVGAMALSKRRAQMKSFSLNPPMAWVV